MDYTPYFESHRAFDDRHHGRFTEELSCPDRRGANTRSDLRKEITQHNGVGHFELVNFNDRWIGYLLDNSLAILLR